MESKIFFGTLLSLSYIVLVSTQGCLRALKSGSDPNDPPFNDKDYSPLPANSSVQAIITTYKFYCDCVNVTTWETYVQPGDEGQYMSREYDITFQVWRPSSTVQDDGCYSLVGENVFTSFTFSKGGFVELTPTPPSHSFITAQSEDVVGYYTNSRDENNQGIQLERESDYTQNVIWFLSVADGSLTSNGINACPYPIGTNRYLSASTGAAPMLKISTTTVTCPPSPSPIPPSSTLIQPMVSSTPVMEVSTTKVLPMSSMNSAEVTSSMEETTQTIDSTRDAVSSSSSSGCVLSSTTETDIATSNILTSEEVMMSTVSDLIMTPREGSTSSQGGVKISSSGLFSPSATPSDFNQNETRANSAIPAVIVIVLLLVVVSIVAVVIVAVLLRKRVTARKIKLNNDVRDLSTPNYDTSPDTFRNKGSKSKNTTGSSAEPTYEYLDSRALEYSYPSPLEYSVPVQEHSKVKESSFNGDESFQDQLYHKVGPDAGLRSSAGIFSDAQSITNEHLLAEERKNTCIEYESVEGAYEEPLPSANKAQNSVRHRNVFNTIGKYVPTEEQRHKNPRTFNETSSANIDDLNFFVEDPTYWSPASTTSELYSQLATKKYRELPRDQIRSIQPIGSGQFGEVYKATWSINEEELELAVKTLKPGASDEDHIKFLQEAAIMGQFNHRNVIKMHGVVTLGEPILICLEILDGDLREYLLKYNPEGSKYDDFMETELMFLRFAKDIATGMDYLSKKNFVHRDLAARNILLNKFLTCKVADFGMARDLMDDTYYTSSGGQIPVKWTAPEALLYKKYSSDSDVWSYGMVLFEIWSVGTKPFSTINNSQTLTLLQEGFCQAPPPGCPRAIYELMVVCWNPQHKHRPSFNSICQKLNESPEKLLYWSPSDDSLSFQVGVCGAELSEAYKLHPDLQKKYST